MPPARTGALRQHRKSQPKKCRFGCGRVCSPKGIYSHEAHHCPKNPKRRRRSLERASCPICGKDFNGHYLRVHMATQHAGEKAKIGRPRKSSESRSPNSQNKQGAAPQRAKAHRKKTPPPPERKRAASPKTPVQATAPNPPTTEEEARRQRVFARLARLSLEPRARHWES